MERQETMFLVEEGEPATPVSSSKLSASSPCYYPFPYSPQTAVPEIPLLDGGTIWAPSPNEWGAVGDPLVRTPKAVHPNYNPLLQSTQGLHATIQSGSDEARQIAAMIQKLHC